MQMTEPTLPVYHTITPYLYIRGAARAIDFLQRAFGATQLMREADSADPQLVRHAEIRIGDSVLMISDERPTIATRSPQSLGGSPVTFFVSIEDVDALYHQAIAAGAKPLGPLENQPYGRSGGVEDPFGFIWYLCGPVKQ
jgi:PhnB protein